MAKTEGRLTFGKYAGKKIRDIADWDPGYLRWLVNQEDLDEGLRYEIEENLDD